MTAAGPPITLGTVNGTAITITPQAGGDDFSSTAKVVIGSNPYVRGPLPPGWPTQPSSSPVLPPNQAAGQPTAIAAGTTVTLFITEAAALVDAGFATYA